MDPAAEITQWVHPVPIPDSPSVDARRLQCSPTLAGPVSKVLDDDNLLIEIIVRLDFPTTLVRAALVCKRWLRHASDPAFIRRFRELHPPRLLGFYLDVRSLSLGFNPTRPCFVPVLPQPPELATVARRVASYSFDAYDHVCIEDLQNGRILIRECTSRFGPGATSYGQVLCSLGPKGAVAILPCPPDDHPMDSRYSFTDYVLFKQGGQDLFYLALFEIFFPHRKNSATQVYMLQDGIWCKHASNPAQHLFQTWTVRPLLVDDKIYIAAAQTDILVLDLRTSSFSKIQLPEGVEYGERNTMFSRTDDDSRVYLFHVKEFHLRVWLLNGDNWLLVDAICLREMFANLRMSDHTVWIDFTDAVKIHQVGENAESACLQIGRSVLYLDIKCRIMHRVYEMTENDPQYLAGIYPFMMIWPPTFPVLKDDLARQESSVEMGGPETLDT